MSARERCTRIRRGSWCEHLPHASFLLRLRSVVDVTWTVFGAATAHFTVAVDGVAVADVNTTTYTYSLDLTAVAPGPVCVARHTRVRARRHRAHSHTCKGYATDSRCAGGAPFAHSTLCSGHVCMFAAPTCVCRCGACEVRFARA